MNGRELRGAMERGGVDSAPRLLKNCRRVLIPSGRLVLVEMVIPTHSPFSVIEAIRID